VGDPFFKKKKQKKADDTPSAFCRFWRPKFAGKSGFFQFKKYFLFKTPRKHLKYLDKPIHGHTKNLKNQNQPETKIILMDRSISLGKEKGKKSRSNPSHEMELINTEIDYFYG